MCLHEAAVDLGQYKVKDLMQMSSCTVNLSPEPAMDHVE